MFKRLSEGELRGGSERLQRCKKWQLSSCFCEHPSQKQLIQNYPSFKKHQSNKMCFMAIHKSLMFAISHAAWHTLASCHEYIGGIYFTSHENTPDVMETHTFLLSKTAHSCFIKRKALAVVWTIAFRNMDASNDPFTTPGNHKHTKAKALQHVDLYFF